MHTDTKRHSDKCKDNIRYGLDAFLPHFVNYFRKMTQGPKQQDKIRKVG